MIKKETISVCNLDRVGPRNIRRAVACFVVCSVFCTFKVRFVSSYLLCPQCFFIFFMAILACLKKKAVHSMASGIYTALFIAHSPTP